MKKLMVLLVAFAMVGVSVMAASAADWNFYGSARLDTYYFKTAMNDYALFGQQDSDNMQVYLQAESRIGARVKVSDTLTGRFEYGAKDGNANVRMLYGKWDFGAGSLYVGRYYTPLTLTGSNHVYNGATMVGWGAIYAGRQDGLKLTFLQGALQLGFYDPSLVGDIGTTQEYTLPKIEASLYYPIDNFAVYGGGGYQSYEADGLDVDSYILAIGGKATFGAFYVSLNYWTGQNVNQMYDSWVNQGSNVPGVYAIANPMIAGAQVLDADTDMYMIYAGYKLNDMVTFEGGYSYQKSELDTLVTKDDQACYYIQAVITLAPGVSITPEIGVFDGQALDGALVQGLTAGAMNSLDQPKSTYYGFKWQVDF